MKRLRGGVRPILIFAPAILLLTVFVRWISMSTSLSVLDVRPSRSKFNTNVDSSEPLSAEKVVLEWDPEGVLKSQSINRESMKREIHKFFDVWNRRPLKSNKGGMGFHHQFMLWYIVRKLQPKLIVESGMKSGATTWLLRDAAPLARIISFDPVEQSDWVKVPKVEYKVGRAFVDLLDYPWDQVPEVQRASAVVLLDDHQAALPRIQGLIAAGFTGSYVVCDDNYPPLSGDNHSLKKVWDRTGSPRGPYRPGQPGEAVMWLSDFKRVQRRITVSQHRTFLPQLQHAIDAYAELPPAVGLNFAALRQRLSGDTDGYTEELLEAITPPPLFATPEDLSTYLSTLGQNLARLAAAGAAAGGSGGTGGPAVDWAREDYTWICLARLRPAPAR